MNHCSRVMTSTGERVRFQQRAVVSEKPPAGDGGELVALWSSPPELFHADPLGAVAGRRWYVNGHAVDGRPLPETEEAIDAEEEETA